jgi:hypothetical protein
MAGIEALPQRNRYVVEAVPESYEQTRSQGLEYMVSVDTVRPCIAFCCDKDAADMIAGALNAQVPVDVVEKPLAAWQVRDLAEEDKEGGKISGVVRITFSETMDGIEAVDDLVCERLAGDDGYLLSDIGFEVVGHEKDNVILVKVTANASEFFTEEELSEQCQNCGRLFKEDELVNPIPDLEQRVAPGEVMPSGECPACGAVCHTVKADE